MGSFEDELAADAAAMRQVSSDGQLSELRYQGEELARLEVEIARTEANLKELKRKHLELSQRTIPDLMDIVGTDHVGNPSVGIDLVVQPYYKAAIPKENMAEASDWLKSHNHGDLMRTVVSVEFGRGEQEHADAVVQAIKGYFRGRNDIQREPVIENAVHWKTLTSFVKEQLERGEELPLDLLGATVGRHATFKKRRER